MKTKPALKHIEAKWYVHIYFKSGQSSFGEHDFAGWTLNRGINFSLQESILFAYQGDLERPSFQFKFLYLWSQLIWAARLVVAVMTESCFVQTSFRSDQCTVVVINAMLKL